MSGPMTVLLGSQMIGILSTTAASLMRHLLVVSEAYIRLVRLVDSIKTQALLLFSSIRGNSANPTPSSNELCQLAFIRIRYSLLHGVHITNSRKQPSHPPCLLWHKQHDRIPSARTTQTVALSIRVLGKIAFRSRICHFPGR